MKKQFAIVSAALAATLGLLLLSACANPFINPMKRETSPASGGKGLVRIGTGVGAARTALPRAVFDHYEYSFYLEGTLDSSVGPTEPNGNSFELASGNWEVSVRAYAEPGDLSLAAEGNETFTVEPGEEIDVVIKLSPVASSGRGALAYTVTYPGAASVVSLTLTRLADTEDIDLALNAIPTNEGLAGTQWADAGYYMVRMVLQKDGVTAGKNEVAHIYNNLTTDLLFDFIDDDFKAELVFSNADSGPGSLRETIANAGEGATIVLDLPASDRVITLTSPLAINKSLTINGGGATLTQNGSNRLVNITGGAATAVVISRVHFKGGRAAGSGGAINAAGRLTLESCVFSDNQAAVTGANVGGGAVYNAAAVTTVRGSTFYMNKATGSSAKGGAIYSYSMNAGLILVGNVFYGNTAPTAPAVYTTGDSLYTFNASYGNITNAGGATTSSDNRTLGARLPISHLSFKPLGGLGEEGVENVIAAKPTGYPAVDFQGRPIPAANVAAGAVQTATASGYILDYAALGPGAISVSSGAVDEDGMTGGTVTLSATANANGEFKRWIVDGTEDPEQSATLSLNVSAHTTVRAVFYIGVNAPGDSVPGSLRDAIATAKGGGVFLSPGTPAALYDDLVIDGNLVIEGNGAKINLNGHHIVINGANTEVTISRVHFTGGRAANGGAIQNAGILTITSSVFSDNGILNSSSSSRGGAIYSSGAATVLGSTFYGNKAGSGQGAAIHKQSGTVILKGNLFWGNTAASYNVASGSPTSQGFNISDKPIGTSAGQSGWTSAAGDAQASSLPLSFVSFKPLAGGSAVKVISQKPAAYPAVDFYGDPIPEEDAAAGAVQSEAGGGGVILDYAARGPGRVTLAGGTVDADGFVSGGSVTLTAVPDTTDAKSGTFAHWLVDDAQQATQPTPNVLILPISNNTTVRAVFTGTYKVTNGGNSGPGSFREALGILADGDTIDLDGRTVILTEPLPATAKQFTILGKSATITQSGFVPGASSQLLSLSGGSEVNISRVHFTGGRTTANGGAVYNNGGTLILESCVFSDNRSGSGGAIYSSGPLTVYASTFYGNSVTGGSGSAIYGSGAAITLAGDLFWGNTPAASIVYGTVTASYTVSDGAISGSTTVASQPIVPKTFKPINGLGADKVIAAPSSISGYPTVDFYGDPLSANAAAGAVQAIATGYLLDYAAVGPGRAQSNTTPNADGLISGSVALTAIADPGKEFLHWIVNGAALPAQTLPAQLNLNVDGHKTVRAIFRATHTVTSSADSGPGSLRSALAVVLDWDRVVLNGQTIVLTTPLKPISKRIFIEGNGATLTQSGFTESESSQLLNISATANVQISRLHVTGGRAANYGAAINNAGILTLESCVFSDNRTSAASAYGGAIYSAGATSSVTICGSTFYGNIAGSAGGSGGAIYKASGALTLTGNLFWGNSAASFSVLSTAGTVPVSNGFNISDQADGTNATDSGWNFVAGDAKAAILPLTPFGFKPLTSGAAYHAITTLPGGYPAKDFEGEDITAPASAGAVQTPISSSTGHVLYYMEERLGSGTGTVTVTSGSPDAGGLFSGSVTLKAAAGSNAEFVRWIVNGQEQAPLTPANELTLIVDEHKIVQAVFIGSWAVASGATAGPGSLRDALDKAKDGDRVVINLSDLAKTITLATPLGISKSLAILGNGATLTQNGFVVNDTSQLVRIGSGAEVRISRLHLTGGRAANYGGAIYNAGTLTLESCVLSDNQAVQYSGRGGAIYIAGGAVTISGCTFYGNAAGATSGMGGAVYTNSGTLTLRGNIFWGNTANSSAIVSGNATSQGYNITDKAIGLSGSGWASAAGDAQAAALPFVPNSFKPFAWGAAAGILSPASDYPTEDFYGNDMPATGAAAGAVQTTAAGYILDYAAQGPGRVTIIGGAPNADGMFSGSVTLRATADPGKNFRHWTVNGTAQGTSAELNLTVSSHTTVRAVFFTIWTLSSAADSGPGSLREALANYADGDCIALQGQTITLASPLPQITRSLIIEGNGATLTQIGFTETRESQLLYINVPTSVVEVRISRIHFTGGRAENDGAAIKNAGGILALESCVFSDNRTSNQYASGGAVFSTFTDNRLIISGCTFYGNVAGTTSGNGGAIGVMNSGVVTLTGNIFWGNTAAGNSLLYLYMSSLVSNGFNIVDAANGQFNLFGANDVEASSLPLHPSSLKPLSTGAAYRAIGTRPAGYPTVDFNGDTIPAQNAMAGAVQAAITSSGYVLDYAAVGSGQVTVKSGTGSDGLYTGSVTLEATVTGGGSFIHWTVNGVAQGTQTPANELTLVMNGHKTVRAIFATRWTVATAANGGSGSLSEALALAQSGDVIALQGQTVTLTEPLPQITKSLTIEGNGATLTQSGFTAGADSQLLNINATTAEVRISRLHLKGGRALNYGAAIALGAGKLTLESCVFSDNQTSSYGYGGALYIGYNANATVSGCTFYGNVVETTNGNGGAIYSEGTLTLTGNLFWGNAASAYSVVRSAYGSFTTQGYNISDKPSGTGSAQSGWNFVTGDAQALGMPLWAADGFKPFSNGAAYQAIAARPSGYPSVDFNGDAIPLSDAMAGAVQTVIATSGYWLDYAAEGPGQVTVLSGTPNTYGFYTGSVILKASPSAGGSFLRWTVDGQEQLGATDELTIAMDSHKTVRAIFANVRTVDSAANDGPGSLREALTNPAEGVYIRLPAGGVITLTTPLPQITKSLTIEGNGATLTRSFNSGSNTQLLDINSATAEVRISRLHFYQGRSNDNGAAIRNQKGILTLESCIFSDNDTSASMAWGGAIYTGGALSVLGCTFTGNDAATPTNGSGGAIYRGGSGTVFLTGNIFAGNTGQYPVVYFTAAGATTGGYNVSDKPSGTSTGQSGWTFDTTDVPSVTDITFDTTFRPSSATTLSILPSLPSGFPTTYFDGTARGANSTPGAMPKN